MVRSEGSTGDVLGLSGDYRLSRLQQLAWLVGNGCRGISSELYARLVNLTYTYPDSLFPSLLDFQDDTQRATASSTPGRMLSLHLLKQLIEKANKKSSVPPHILDIGCGSGYFAKFFMPFLGSEGTYCGVDIARKETWQTLTNQEQRIQFVEDDAVEFVKDTPHFDDYNFIFSHSAFEHIRRDKLLCQIICERQSKKQSVMHVHVVPSVASLPLYRCHGYRIYSLLDMHKLAKILKLDSYNIIGIGGFNSWWLHLTWITQHMPDGQNRRMSNPTQYAEKVRLSCSADKTQGSSGFQIFWMLVGSANPSKVI